MERPIFPTTQKEAKKSGKAYSSADNKAAIFPTQLRELRAKKGISQEGLSKVLGVSKSTLGLWENGDTLPDAKSLHDLAIYYGVSSDYLIGLSKVPTSNVDVKAICEYTGLSSETVSFLNNYSTCAPTISSFVTRFFEDIVVLDSSILEDMCIDVVRSAHSLAIYKKRRENMESIEEKPSSEVSIGTEIENIIKSMNGESDNTFTISALDASAYYLGCAVNCVRDSIQKNIETMVDELAETYDSLIFETPEKRIWPVFDDKNEDEERFR